MCSGQSASALSRSAVHRRLSSDCRWTQNVDLERLRLDHPKLAHLCDLASGITDPVFGSKDIFLDRTEADDATLQREGETLVPELISGKYDAGLTAAVKRNVGTWRSPRVSIPLDRLPGSGQYRGSQFEVRCSATTERSGAPNSIVSWPQYIRPWPRHLRIEGKVQLQLSVETATGDVLGVLPISGHPFLRPSAIEAAGQWRFEPKSIDSKTLNHTLDFALRCR